MLTVDQARGIADHWRPQFLDEAGFEQSWSRFFSMVGDPTVDKLEAWLAKDQAKDAVVHAGIVREPLVPRLQDLDSRIYDVLIRGTCARCGGDPVVCSACHGLGFVRNGHGGIGPCPRCR